VLNLQLNHLCGGEGDGMSHAANGISYTARFPARPARQGGPVHHKETGPARRPVQTRELGPARRASTAGGGRTEPAWLPNRRDPIGRAGSISATQTLRESCETPTGQYNVRTVGRRIHSSPPTSKVALDQRS
jgi:hypothetical protein